MPTILLPMRRAIAALVVSSIAAGAQQVATPPLRGLRVAGELGAGTVGFTLGAEAGLVVAAGVAYLATGKGGDVNDPRLQRRLTPFLWAGGGLGASTSAWLASRVDGQTSDWALNAAVTTVVTAVAFRYAGWPMTAETDARRRTMGRWRKLAPVWMSAVTATAIATATREMR
jgi:hypothetical protein